MSLSGRYDRTYPIGPEKELVVRAFEVFPRRATNITVRVREADDAGPDRHVGEFTIRNPVRGPFKEWSPEPLPVTRRDGEIEFTLTKLVVASHDGSRAVQHMQAFFASRKEANPVRAGRWQALALLTPPAIFSMAMHFTPSARPGRK